MRFAALVLTLLPLGVSACAGGASTSSDASCAAVVNWKGVRYEGSGARVPVELGNELGDGRIPECGDQPDVAPDPARAVDVLAIQGVDPRIAVSLGQRWEIYLAPPYSGPSPAEAPAVLETALYGPRCETDAPFTLEGFLVGAGSEGGLPLSISIEVERTDSAGEAYLGRSVGLLVDRSTRGPNTNRELGGYSAFEDFRIRGHCVAAARPSITFVADSRATSWHTCARRRSRASSSGARERS
jgi:hypothetical protein